MNSYPIIAQTPTVATPGIQQETPAERILRLNGLQGDPRESLKSLEENSSKRENWRDGINKIFGTDPKSNPDAINWEQREFDGDGRVKVTKFDALIGRSQPELQAAWERFRRDQLKKEYGGEYLAETGQILKPNQRSNADTVQRNIQSEIDRKSDIKEPLAVVSSMSGFTPEMLPDRPSVQQINQLIAKLKPQQQSTIDAGRQLESQLDTEESSRQTAQSMRDLNVIQGQVAQQEAQTSRDRLTLEGDIANINRVIAENNLASSDYNAAEDRRLREQQNQMTMQLAIMKQDDNKADRAERRDDRRYENRQAAIIALIQGLARLGQGFQL